MPRATTNVDDTEKKDLKSCSGGYVLLKKMTYGELLHRRAMSANLKVAAKKGSKDFEGEMALLNQKATEYEFAHCIVDHNLEDENGNKLIFTNPAHVAALDPRIGSEIGKYIDEMNQFEDEDTEEGN